MYYSSCLRFISVGAWQIRDFLYRFTHAAPLLKCYDGLKPPAVEFPNAESTYNGPPSGRAGALDISNIPPYSVRTRRTEP